ncbi:MAG: lactonase family protein, partial [Gammaproteobacteria bacterium]|nr:lactonase family protein [Gammaproteobacteria bacterium]
MSLLLAAAVESPAQILEAVELIDDQPPLSTVTSIEISPDGNHLYAVSPAAQLVSAYARDAETGSLSLLDSDPYDTAGITSSLFGSQASLIQDAQFLLVGSLFETGRDLAIFHRDAASGELELLNDSILTIDEEQIMVRYAVSPDGNSLYVIIRTPQQFPDSIFNLLTYSISSSGTTALLDTRVIPDVGPALITGSLQVSPDGRHLYVAGEPGFIGPGEPGQLFSRNLSTGLLTSLDDLEELSLIGQPATT